MRTTKRLILACLLGFGAHARAASLLCHGPARLISSISVEPRVHLTVDLVGCAQLLDAGRVGRLTVDLDEEPLVYEGPLHPDGKFVHRTSMHPETQDFQDIKFEILADDSVAVELTFRSAGDLIYGRIDRAVLKCRRFE